MLFRRKEKIKKPLFRRIINYFIYSGIGLITLLLIVFGITQTSTFRNWLKDFVIEQVNTSTNGKLSLERIDGTILTSLILKNAAYTFEDDTVFSADKIEIKTSPLKIFFKIIYFRKIEIENANITFLKDKNGELNISRIISPSEEEEDTTESVFNWKIEISDLSLKNINFRLQSDSLKNSRVYYDHPNPNDLRLRNLNLSLYAFADINGNEYAANIKEFNVQPNLLGFNLKNLSGNLLFVKDMAGISDFEIETNKSEITLNAAVEEFPAFGETEVKLENSPFRLQLSATDFNFDDLTTFIEGTEILKGNVETHIGVEGTLSDLTINELQLEFGETNLEAEGRIQNTLDGADMVINTLFTNSAVNQDDIKNLLPTINIPLYPDYGVLNFDSLYFAGSPLNFDAGFNVETDKGNVISKVKLDLREEEISYDIGINTTELDLNPVAGVTSNLNCTGTLKGKGFSPSSLITLIDLKAGNSTVGEQFFDEFNMRANGENGITSSDISFRSNVSSGKINTAFNFNDTSNVKYNFDILLNGININDFVKGSDLETNLNMTLKGEGENFDQEKINLFASIEIDSSTLNSAKIDSTDMIIDIRSGESERAINIISDLADLTLVGDFTIPDLIEVVTVESGFIAKSIQKQVESIRPALTLVQPITLEATEKETTSLESALSKKFSLDYLLEFKDFELLSLFLGDADIEVDGDITGAISAEEDSFTFTLESQVRYLRYWNGKNLVYLSGFEMFLDLEDKISSTSLDDFLTHFNMKAKRFIAGSEIKNLVFNMNLEGNNAGLEFSTTLEDDLNLRINGNVGLNDESLNVLIDTLYVKYLDYSLLNDDKIDFSYSKDNFQFNKFTLLRGDGTIDLKGNFSLADSENIEIKIVNLDGMDLSSKLLELPPDKGLDTRLNLNLRYTGTAYSPVIKAEFTTDSIKFQKLYLGAIQSRFEYINKSLSANFQFIKENGEKEKPRLNITGSIPVDLAINAPETITKDKELDLYLVASKFDLRAVGNLIPGISDLNGIIGAEIRMSGFYDDLNSVGSLFINNSSFRVNANNLIYTLVTEFQFKDNEIVIPSLTLKNNEDTRRGGTITGSGKLTHYNFEPSEIEFHASGDLKIMDEEKTRAVSPSLYGDIVIRTQGDIIYEMNENQNYIIADLVLKRGSNITYSPAQTAFTNETDKFIYVFAKTDTSLLTEEVIDSLITISESKSEGQTASTAIPIDLDIKVEVEDEVKMVFVLSREFKQNLTAYLGGKFEYVVENDVPIARGELKLLEGSKLDFIKTFQAEGTVKFYDEIDNPYMDIVATYESYYNPDTSGTSTGDSEVRVKIKLEGPAKGITSNFIREERNVEVYMRRSGFGQFELDASKTASDAMFFIIAGKFPEDATVQETNVAVSTAASLAGSVVGGLLNEQLGDVVRSVNVRQRGTETVFSLIGKWKEFRYEIGGTSQVFQDLSRANVKIEHPLFIPRLMLRLQRREPTYESTSYGEMINEIGLKYGFEF